MSKILIWMHLCVLKSIKKKIISIGKNMAKIHKLSHNNASYAITGHKIDLSVEIENLKAVLSGIEIEIKKLREESK